MSNQLIDAILISYGFTKIHNLDKEFDYDKFSHILRIHEMHYLFYSEDLKYFSIGVKYERPKGKAGGGYDQWNHIMIPKCINSVEDAVKLLEGIL